METYSINTKCSNCGEKERANIEKGNTIKEWLRTMNCLHCGCKTLMEHKTVREIIDDKRL